MFCTKCGKELPDKAVFCIGCGARISANEPSPEQNIPQPNTVRQLIPEQYQQPVIPTENPIQNPPNAYGVPQGVQNPAMPAKQPFDINRLLKNKLVWIGLGAVIVLIIAVIIISNIASSAGSAGFKGTAAGIPYAFFETSEGVFIYKGEKKIAQIDAYTDYTATSADNTVCAFIDTEKTLYLLSGGKSSTVDTDVKFVIVSDDGSSLAYYNSDNEIWYFRSGSKKKIAESEGNLYVNSIEISPDGGTVIYTIKENDVKTAYIFNGSKSEKLGTNLTPVSVSNGGSIIYALNDNNRILGYIKNKKGDGFVSIKSFDSSCILSEDKKSLKFEYGGSSYYFDTSLEEPIKICSGSVSVVLPAKTTGAVSSFKNFLGVINKWGDMSIYRFELKDGEFEKTKIISDSYQYQVSPDGNSIIYLKNGKLYKVDTKTGEKDDVFAEITDENIMGFIAVPDFSGFYLVDDDSNLYYVGKNGGITKRPFAENVSGAAVDDSGVIAYITDYSGGSGTLYYSSRGEKGRKVSGVGECSSVYADTSGEKYSAADLAGSTVYAYDSDGVLYVSTNGKDFKKTRIER